MESKKYRKRHQRESFSLDQAIELGAFEEFAIEEKDIRTEDEDEDDANNN